MTADSEIKERTDAMVSKAMDHFNCGFECSQAVLSAYCASYGLDTGIACRIASGFGAGMGRLGKTCGAVTGAYMVIGLIHGKEEADDDASRERTYGLVQEFDRLFVERNGSTSCGELLDMDLITGDQQKAREKVIKICLKLVSDAVEILEEVLNNLEYNISGRNNNEER